MANRYQIWDRESTVFTPGIDPAHGRMDYTPEEWIARYPWATIPGEHCVLASGLYNGGFCMPLSEMRRISEGQGAVFEEGLTPEALLSAIEAFEDTPVEAPPSAEERIAAALEYQNLTNM